MVMDPSVDNGVRRVGSFTDRTHGRGLAGLGHLGPGGLRFGVLSFICARCGGLPKIIGLRAYKVGWPYRLRWFLYFPLFALIFLGVRRLATKRAAPDRADQNRS